VPESGVDPEGDPVPRYARPGDLCESTITLWLMFASRAGFLLIRLASPTPSPHSGHTHPVTHSVPPAGGTPESIILATWITAVATGLLAIFAVVTAWYARKAFREQSEEVSTLKEQVKDQQDLNAKQTPVLELQARELRESLDELKREAEDQRRSQANKVAAWIDSREITYQDQDPAVVWGAVVRNASDLPIVDVRVYFYYISDPGTGAPWEPKLRGPSVQIRVIPPLTDRFVVIPEEITRSIGKVSDVTSAVRIHFTDAAGSYWQRSPRGALTDSQPP
jgi:hypothetical protein